MEVSKIVNCLLEGGIALLPTDTVYGLAVHPDNAEAVEKLYHLKSRPRSMPLPIMVSSSEDIEYLGLEMNSIASAFIASSYMPGALSLILGFKDNPLVPWLEGREEVAIRIPDDERLLSVLKQTGPLLVTSANRHAEPLVPKSIYEILSQLEGKPDVIIDEGEIDREMMPSTIINCRLNPPVVERMGGNPPVALLNEFGLTGSKKNEKNL